MRFAPQKISEADTEQLEKCMDVANIIKAIENMKVDVAPGVDGISILLLIHT